MRIMILIIITFLTGLMACEETPMPPVPPIKVQDTIFELIWNTKFDSDNGILSTDFTQHYKDWVLIGGDNNNPPTILAFNKKTGNKDWEYIHQGAVNNEIDASAIFENIYIAICSHGIVAIDLDTRQSIWELDYYPLDYYRGNSNTIINGYLYLNIQIDGAGLEAKASAFIKVNH